ncbi:MAG: trehalose-phosphatase [Sphingomonadales bacterium]
MNNPPRDMVAAAAAARCGGSAGTSAIDEERPLQSSRMALFLDLDGTLIDIRETPDAVEVPRELPGVLERAAMRLDGALAVVSGRSIADIDRLLAPLVLPVAGQHGGELRGPGDSAPSLYAQPVPELARRELAALATAFPGVEVEDKGLSVALHYRRAPEALPVLRPHVEALAARCGEGVTLVHGRKVLELRDTSISKGTSVAEFMRSPPFSGRVPVFVGDDITDEDGFAAAEGLGGVALPVGSVHRPRRDTAFAAPAQVRAWLENIARGAGGT